MRGGNLRRTAYFHLAGHIDIPKRIMIFCISEILHTPTVGETTSETSGELQNGPMPPGPGKVLS